MAEHPNAALIKRAYEAFTNGNYIPVVTELFSEDVVWHLPGRGPLAGERRGRDAVLAAMREFEQRSGHRPRRAEGGGETAVRSGGVDLIKGAR